MDRYEYLDVPQLLKHILGLKSSYPDGFTLLYLWYDVLGEEGAIHRKEINTFSEVVKDDDIRFHSISTQELNRMVI